MLKLLFIAGGGALGAVLRYAIGVWAQRFAPAGLPLGTITVNLIGCLFIGIVAALAAGPFLGRPEHRAFVLVGLLGAFTTFSTFAWESLELMNDRAWGMAAVNIVVSNVFGLLGVWVGYRLTSQWLGI